MLSGPALRGAETTGSAADESGDGIRVLAYNAHNLGQADGAAAAAASEAGGPVAAVVRTLLAAEPDIAVLAEVGSEAALGELRSRLQAGGRPYPFSTLVAGSDEERHLGVVARLAPARVLHSVDSAYNLRGQRVPVQRGFAYCLFEWPGGYVLHLIGAHLKSRVFDPLGQTDMRRYEARQLRYLVDDILAADPAANVLVLGDLNDTPDSSPLSALYGRRSKPERQLYDLRPQDGQGQAWTHHWAEADAYTRIDYLLASHGLLAEVCLDRCVIPAGPDWYLASDHRPVMVTLRPQEGADDPARLAAFERNIRRSAGPPAEPGRAVGSRKARK